MSRTRRYVPHHVIRNHLHPWIDPMTLEPYKWGSPERQQYYKQREASNLRGQDGRHRHVEHWGYHWMEPMDAIRTSYKRLIAEGIEDHYDALEDEGKIFDFMGVDQDELDAIAWYDAMMDDYFAELENDRFQAEMDAEYRERELDDFYDSCFDYDYDYSY